MSQITKDFVETLLRAAEAGRHTPLTIWQETQLALAWLELEEHRTRLNTSFPDVEAQVFAINDSVEGDEVVPAALARELVGMLADQTKRERENAIILSMGANQTVEMSRRAEVAERRVRELELDASFHRRDMAIAVANSKATDIDESELLTRADIANGHGEGPFVSASRAGRTQMTAKETLTVERIETWRTRSLATEKFYGIPEDAGEANALCDLALIGLSAKRASLTKKQAEPSDAPE